MPITYRDNLIRRMKQIDNNLVALLDQVSDKFVIDDGYTLALNLLLSAERKIREAISKVPPERKEV